MTRRFRLGAVHRARQAQEEVAKAAVLNARADAARAVEQAVAADEAIDREVSLSAMPSVSAARGLVSTLMIRRLRAGDAAAAYQAADDAEHTVTERIGEWSEAAVQFRMVDKLAERHQEETRRAEVAGDQLVIDELATTATSRQSARESRP